MEDAVEVLLISGSMGAGKTAVLAEASDLLTAANIHHAAIDMDYLALGHLPANVPEDVAYRNLADIWRKYCPAGVRRLLLSEALVSAAQREQIARAIPGARIQVCRLRASLQTMQARVAKREPGMLRGELVARAAELEAALDDAGTENFQVDNDSREITEVAREVLARAGWL